MSAALRPDGGGRGPPTPPTPVTPLRPPWASVPLLSRNLSPRQVEVARLVARGLSYRLVAVEIGRTHATVSRHVEKIVAVIPEDFKDAADRLAHNCILAYWIYAVESGRWPQRTPDELRALGAL